MSNPGKEILEHLGRLGSPALAAQVLDVFLQDTSTKLDALRVALDGKDGKGIYGAAHTIQGSASMIGAVAIAQACAELAAAARSESFDRCEVLAEEVFASFQAIQRSVAG